MTIYNRRMTRGSIGKISGEDGFWGVAPHQPPSRAQVVDNQRRRLMLGMTRVVARKGYPDATVADVLAEVRVSRRTFYELFKDKEDCFVAVHDVAHRALVDAVKESQRGVDDPLTRIEAAHRAYLAFFRDQPEVGAAILRGVRSGGDRIDERSDRALHEFAELHAILHAQCRRRVPELPVPPTTVFRALVEGANHLMAREVLAGRADRIMDQLPAVLYMSYSVYGLTRLAAAAIGDDSRAAADRSSHP